MRRCLLISPYFPPVGVSGTKRALHLSRNLPSYGWDPVILTGEALGEPIDESLVECVPAERLVSRGYAGRLRPLFQRLKGKKKPSQGGPKARRSAPSPLLKLLKLLKPKNLQYWLPFDRYWLDNAAGYREMRRLALEASVEVIHVSADPWAPLKAAERVSRELKLPLVVDFRDPWSVHEGKMALRPALTQRLIRRFEARLFKQASAIILNTETARDVYVERYQGRVPAEKFYAVRNAFDRGLFRAPEGLGSSPKISDERPSSPDPFTALYFGRFRAFVSPELLFKGFACFAQAQGLGPSEAILEVVGGLSDEHLALAERCGVREHLKQSPPVPFRACLPTLQRASALVLVIEPECYMQIPGKLYDYFAAARPIIALSANQEANGMITEVGMGSAVAHQDLDAITRAFSEHYTRWREGAEGQPADLVALVEPYSASSQAQQVSSIYERVCARRP